MPPIPPEQCSPYGSPPGEKLLQGYMSEEAVAAELCLTVRALQLWRQHRTGPPWVKIGRKVFYARDAVLAWVRSRQQQPVRQRRSA
jgi:hypothetical protein